MKEYNTQTYNAIDIARKVVARTDIERGDSITNLKLQKLLYYLQGFWLAEFDTPLFDEPIEAWAYGPVVPSVYDAYKSYGKKAIEVNQSEEPIRLASDKEEAFFDEVYSLYNQYSASALVRMTHNKMPWASSKSHGFGEEISREKMRDFFRKELL